MSFFRRRSLNGNWFCVYCLALVVSLTTWSAGQLYAYQTPQGENRQPPTPAETAKPKPASPFEEVPQSSTPSPQPPKPAAPFERVPEAPQPSAAKPTEPAAAPVQDIIEAIEFRGARRVPQATLRALIFSKTGDRFDPNALHRDFMALWNSGRFDDITVERERGKTGWIIRFQLVERRVIRTIKYEGNKSATVSDILDRFKERRVGLSVESQYDRARVQQAAVVLKELLAERGRQFATVEPVISVLPPSSVEVLFRINEGPKVKVGKIEIEGNQAFGDRALRRAMKQLRPIGIPYSLFLENVFAKTYDITKLEEDKERIRQFYMNRGYFLARTGRHDAKIRDVGGGDFRVPIFFPNKPGKRADVKIFIEEGRQYRLGDIKFAGVKLFKTPEALMAPLFRMQKGDIFSVEKLRKGMENLTKLYGEFGYIDAVPEPDFDPLPNTDQLNLIISIDEGQQFFVRRIDFTGNTTTRDKVIRRELLIDEGDVFNSRFWELSILRLNQLGYFEQLKEKEAAEIRRDPRTSTVDINLKVKERGKNAISLNGGVSGIAGSFMGFGYSTNNFLGLGETLSISAQLGDRLRSVSFGFTEPYLFDRPIQTGFTVYTQRFNYDQAREVSLFSGRNLIPFYQALGTENLLNYTSNGYGFTTFISYPLRRTFARVGLTYGYDRQDITPVTTGARQYFEYIDFQNFEGANSLRGVVTSRITPSYTYNTVDHPITPTRGKEFYFSLGYAGGPLGGNVNMLEPTLSWKHFFRGLKQGHVVGYRVLGRFITGYGGKVAPPFYRVFMGGEQDVRGFEIWSIVPFAFTPSMADVPVLNEDGSARTQTLVGTDGKKYTVNVTQRIPIYQLTMPGGDTQAIANFEYRIPLFGPLTLAAFFDAGWNKVVRADQLRLNQSRVEYLNAQFPQAGFENRVDIAKGTQLLRTSTGLELQVMMPVVNAPFRLYYAYNPTVFQGVLTPPIAADRSYFPNNATFLNATALYGLPRPYREERTMFRFTISRTF